MIVGDKEKFAIEFEAPKSTKDLASGILWLKGMMLGSTEYALRLDILLSRLQHVAKNNVSFIEEGGHPHDQIDELLDLHRREDGSSIASLGEDFDDYEMYYFNKGSDIYFLWLRDEEPFFTYVEKAPYKGLVGIDKRYFNKVVEHFSNELKA